MNAEDAGIGDPSWYEWTVGQQRVVDMLDPDSQISSVTFQKIGVKGLDDVVVAYSDGRPDDAIQVKHTRVGDTLTFGDIVTSDSRGTSLLAHLASSWRAMTGTGKKYRAVLYTNRSVGVTRASVTPLGGEPYSRPALAEFWAWLAPLLATATSFAELAVPGEWSRAWDEWTGAISVLATEAARLEFLKSLEIRTDQLDLKALHSRVVTDLTKRFGVTDAQGRVLAKALDGALRTWTTSQRRREAVTVEDVMEVLCLPDAGLPRDHALAPPAPFFLSRDTFVEGLGNTLKSRAAPVVFLTGPPGCGKTSIVSTLANRHDAVVLLRFHAFRPITPGDTLLPEDSGRATTARALWGDFLSQLRFHLRGRLARFGVPVRNEFLSESELRAHVLRLAAAWAAETGTTAVLAVDGLDHAARSQDPHHASLLRSLPSPESVPPSVALLVAGQPPAGNPEYPVWLRGTHPHVLVRQVPDIAPDDIAAALSAQRTAIPAWEHAAARRIIAEFAGGNTLSAMFGIYEAALCTSAQALNERLQTRRLSDGLSAYYDAIWSKAVQGAEAAVPLIGTHVAAALSLSSAPLSSALLRHVFPSILLGVEQWQELLSRLTPLVVESADGFRLHHNDVRVHLMRQLQSQQQTLLKTASGLARTYVADPALVPQKHAQAVRLFVLCQDWAAAAQVLSPKYVLEGWVLGRSPDEIGDDLSHAFRAVAHTKDWTLLHQVCCAALTLRQLRHSASVVSPSEEHFPGLIAVSPLLPSEARVAPQAEWTGQLVRDVVRDAWTLVRHSQCDRARQLLRRWFTDLSPTAIAGAMPGEDRQVRQSDLNPALELWGRVCAHVGRAWSVGDVAGAERDHEAEEAFLSGELDEAVRLGGVRRIDAALQSESGFDADRVAAAVDILLAAARWREVVPFLRKLGPDVPSSLRLRLALAALITRRHLLSAKFMKSFVTSRFEALSDTSGSMDAVAHHAWLCILLGWMERSRKEPSAIRDEGLDAMFSRRIDARDRPVLGVLFESAAALGRALGAFADGGSSSAEAYLSPVALGKLLQLILDTFSAHRLHVPMGAHPAATAIVQIATMLSRKVGPNYVSQVANVLARHVVDHPLRAREWRS